MKKTMKTLLTVLISVILAIALLGCALIAFVSWVWGGVRFSSEDAIEAVGLTLSELPCIEGKDGCFYYRTAADTYDTADQPEHWEDWICEVYPVIKNDIGMWYAVTRPKGYSLSIDGREGSVGTLMVTEINERYHCFILPSMQREMNDTYEGKLVLPEGFPKDFTSISVNGQETELFMHSYFVTDEAVDEFELGGVGFHVDGQWR